MKAALYNEIVGEYLQLRKEHGINQIKLIIDRLASRFVTSQFDFSALFSLVNYEYRKEAKTWQNQSLKNHWPEIVSEWNGDASILQLAEKYHLCAYTLLRHMANELCENKEEAKKWLKDSYIVNRAMKALKKNATSDGLESHHRILSSVTSAVANNSRPQIRR